MIDTIAILTTHILLGIAFWKLSARDDLDADDAVQRGEPGFAWRAPN